MTDKSADMSTVAARLSWVEDAYAYLKDKPSEGGGGDGLTDLIKKLWRNVLRYDNSALTEDPWTTTSVYETLGTSLHYCIMSEDTAVPTALSNKPLYNWIFSVGDTRWNNSNPTRRLADDIVGTAADGYTAALRGKSWSLAQSVWGTAATMTPTPAKTIVARIADVQTSVNALRNTELPAKVEELQDQIDDIWTLLTTLSSQQSAMGTRLNNVESRLTAGGH
ncbi:hypothetical protein [Pararhizobium sp.]|uniref:hypothetical protein n=1 Tax=Pararhizobium sp. TaxID=1977563 RepID=UPI003D148A03